MKLTARELEFLCAWAREEKQADPYALPAHRLQAEHQVPGVTLIRAIKAWARSAGRRDEDIFALYSDPQVCWPWHSRDEMIERLTGACHPV